jgi:hypothetical protein
MEPVGFLMHCFQTPLLDHIPIQDILPEFLNIIVILSFHIRLDALTGFVQGVQCYYTLCLVVEDE